MLTFGKSGSGASGCYRLISYFGVSKFSNSFLFNENYVTYGAMLTFGKTSSGTSGSYCRISYFGVRELIDSFFFATDLRFAFGAVYYAIVRAFLRASSLYSILFNCV